MPTTAPGATGSDPLDQARIAASELARRTGVDHHDVLIVLGTGLAPVAALLGAQDPAVDLANLPWFPRFSGHGHRALAWSFELEHQRVLVTAGRLHLYEARGPIEVAHTVRMAAAAGCHTAVLTCAAGGISDEMTVGSIAVVSDHLNLTATSPLAGIPADSQVASPFVDLVDAWSPRLRAKAHTANSDLREGVYAQLPGPHFETPAEIRMLAGMGADLVGMSMTLEAIAARHLGVEVLGLAVITNRAAGLSNETLTPEDVIAVSRQAAERIAVLIRACVAAEAANRGGTD
jgi:purine-nucleoside phosphorylase